MVEDKITIPYQIKGVKPSISKEGYVEVLMTPVDKMVYDYSNNTEDMPIKISGIGPSGTPFPPELQQQLSQMLKSAMSPIIKPKKGEDPRSLTHVESEIDFLARDWKYGDIINITLEKIKHAEEVEQKTEREKN